MGIAMKFLSKLKNTFIKEIVEIINERTDPARKTREEAEAKVRAEAERRLDQHDGELTVLTQRALRTKHHQRDQ